MWYHCWDGDVEGYFRYFYLIYQWHLMPFIEFGFDPWVRKIPQRRECLPTAVSLLENSMDTGAWWATVHGVTKSLTRLSN